MKYFREAAARRPACGIVRAWLAWALHLSGDEQGARREAAEALRLDGLTTYSVRKLDGKSQRLPDPLHQQDSTAQYMRRLAAPGGDTATEGGTN